MRDSRAVHTLARTAVACVFLWHGLVPKLVFRHPDEAVMLTDGGIGASTAALGVTVAGVGEIALGLYLLAFRRSTRVFYLVIALMVLAVAGVAVTSPRFLASAFNPVTLNGCVIALSVIALWTAESTL